VGGLIGIWGRVVAQQPPRIRVLCSPQIGVVGGGHDVVHREVARGAWPRYICEAAILNQQAENAL